MRESGVGVWWWRFTDYQIEDCPAGTDRFPCRSERYIRPTAGAHLEPYQITLDSINNLEGGKGRRGHFNAFLKLDLANEAAIIDWCRNYGLLGILSQETIRLQLAARWRSVRQTDSSGSRRMLTPYETIYFRSSTGWANAYESTLWSRELAYEGNEDQRGCLVEPAGGALPNPSMATTMPIFSHGYVSQPLEEAIGHFFPLVPLEEKNTFFYPQPLSEEFWHHYAEPLGYFQSVASDFRYMMDNLSYAGLRNDQFNRATGRTGQGKSQLNSLLSISPSLRIEEDGSTVPMWDFPSLLAVFAFEVWQNLIGGQSIRHCQRTKCGRLFLSAQYNRGYCSDRCRWAEEKFRQRRRDQPQ